MYLICSGAGDDIDNAAAGVTVFRRKVVGLQVEFLNRIGIRERYIHVEISIVVADAVKLIVHLSHAGAVHARGLLIGVDAPVPTDAAAVAAQIDRARAEKNQPLRQPAVKRQFRDLFLVDQLAHGSATCIDQIGVGLHRDPVGDLAYLKHNILAGELVDGELNAFLNVSGKARLIGRQLVTSDGQPREQKPAIFARTGIEGETRFRALDRDACPRDGRSGRVSYRSAKAGGGVLRSCDFCAENQNDRSPTDCHISIHEFVDLQAADGKG